MLSRFDSNRNGRLEASEALTLGFPTAQVDLDRDGELTREELHTYLSSLQEEAGDTSTGLPGWFFELDVNRDNQVAMAEFATEWTDAKLTEFRTLDANDDGLLTATEALQSKALSGGTYSNLNAEVLPPRKTIISEIEISENHLIADLNVELSITHSSVSFLDGYLTGPDGTRVELFTSVGGSGDHFDKTIFDDQSRVPITKTKAPFRGEFQPEALLKREPSLSHFNGKPAKGVWQLVIRGTRNERFGMLHSWGLIIRPREDGRGPSVSPMLDEETTPPDSESTEKLEGQSEPKRDEDERRGSNEPVRKASKELSAAELAEKLEAQNRLIEEFKKRLNRLEGEKSR